MNKKALIVGAGLSGSTVARVLAENGYKVTVWEKENEVGGAIADYKKDDYFVQKHGPHLFHTSSESAYKFLSRFTEWFDYRHTVRANVEGKYIPVPFNFTSLEMLYPEKEAKEIEKELVSCFGADTAVPISELRKSDNPEIKKFAEFVYKTVFEYYSFKQWGLDMGAIDPAVFKRVPVRTGYLDGYFADKYQAMPTRGFSEIIRNMLAHENITVETGVDALGRLKVENGKLLSGGKEVDYPVVYTACPDELLGNIYGALPYRTLRFDFEEVGEKDYQPFGVVNYTVSEKFTRISEYKKFTVPSSNADTSVIVREYPLAFEKGSGLSPYYPMPTEQAKEAYKKYAEYAKNIENLYFAGRLGAYVYVNMDKAVDGALALAERLI